MESRSDIEEESLSDMEDESLLVIEELSDMEELSDIESLELEDRWSEASRCCRLLARRSVSLAVHSPIEFLNCSCDDSGRSSQI